MKNLSAINENKDILTKEYAFDYFITLKTDQYISGIKTFLAPAGIDGNEQTTLKIETSNGGAIILGKEGPNSGTMIRLDQHDGTCRLRFRGSSTAGAMVWEQPEQGAQLYIDLGKEGSDKHRISFPSSAGTLALTSQIPTVNNGTLTIQKNGTTVKTFSANQSGNVTANITVPTKVSELTNDSGFTSNAGTITGIKMNGASKGTSGVVDLGTVLTNDGGTINKSKTVKMDASANSDGANLKWGTVNSKNPYIGYASDQVDGTFVVGSLLGTNYASGLAIGGGSGNLLWKGAKVATTSDIPTVNNGTLTIKKNGTSVGTFTANQSGASNIDITFHLYEHNIYLSCSNTTSTVAPSRAYVYFTVITTDATAWTWNNLISPNYFAGKSITINAGGHGYVGDPEGSNRSFNASVQYIFFSSSYIYVTMVYNNSLLGVDNDYSGVFFYSNGVTITDRVRTIL